MCKNLQAGMSVVSLIVIILVLLTGVIWWKESRNDQQGAVASQKQEFQQQIEREKNKQAFDKAIAELGNIYERWKDTLALADHTSRVALSGPVEKLQSIKRETASMLVPKCLVEPKKKMVNGMEKIIAGFLKFMSDADYKPVDEFKEGIGLFSEYEQESATCAQ